MVKEPKSLEYCSPPQMSAGAFCYLVFFGICIGVAAYVYFIIPETKNKTFVEISQMFASRNNCEIETQPLTIADQLSLQKMNGYGALEAKKGHKEILEEKYTWSDEED